MKQLLLAVLLLQLMVGYGSAQETSWEELNTRAIALNEQGQHSEAIKLEEKALKVAQERYGDNHAKVGLSLNKLGEFYLAQGKFTEAESFFQRSLAILLMTYTRNHPAVVSVLHNLTVLFENTDSETEAAKKIEEINREIGDKAP